MFSLGFISKGDLKVHLWFNGCISACMFYNSPLFKYSQEWQLHPSSEVNEETFSTMSNRVSDFLQMNQFVEQFVEDQKVKLDNKVLLIKADKRLNDEEKNKKIDSAMETIMRSEVNAKARDVETACVHNHPLDGFGEEYGPCILHMSTNEF